MSIQEDEKNEELINTIITESRLYEHPSGIKTGKKIKVESEKVNK